MRKLTIAAAMLAVLGVAAGATVASNSAGRALARAEGFAQQAMPIDQITSNAKDLPVQSFDAF
jgi:hypothetical protein